MYQHQKGMTLTSFIFTVACIGFVLYIGMALFPMYEEFYAVRTSMKSLKDESISADTDPSQIKEMLFRRLSINEVDHLKRENVKFDRTGPGWRISVNYEVRHGLIGNLDIVGKFSSYEELVIKEAQ